MTPGRGRRFRALVRRQLDLFAADERGLLDEAQASEEAWNAAGREGAEEAYGDWQLVADAIAERLLEIRDAYAATLDEAAGHDYRAAFDRAAARRYSRFASLLGE